MKLICNICERKIPDREILSANYKSYYTYKDVVASNGEKIAELIECVDCHDKRIEIERNKLMYKYMVDNNLLDVVDNIWSEKREVL